MCGREDEEGEELVRCCENGHFLHQGCLESLKLFNCPMCRSETLQTMMFTTTIPMHFLAKNSFSLLGAVVAVAIGHEEYQKNLLGIN
jgi:hypothetical protein